MRDPLEALRTIFGFQGFRGAQQAIVEDVMAGRDAALIMPTGAGKSLCYQIPAICRPGCGIIISPLIALMQDQVRALLLAGVRAAALNSQSANNAGTMARLRDGDLDLLYVAPERATTESFHRLAADSRIALIAIDEAHCVSQWGHDFRPDYRRLRALADALPGVPRMALTATADAMTRADICEQLGIQPARMTVAGFDRPNIRYEASPKHHPAAQILAFVRAQGAVPGIVYCQTRADAEKVSGQLAAAGLRSWCYHAGMDAGARMANQQAFQQAEDGVMAATVAFGMGIDKPDIRFVVHLGLPKSIESYYQETGRAGRDGAPSVAHLYWGPEDVILARQRIAQSEADAARKAHERAMLDRMAGWADTIACRRVPLLTHFGEIDPQPCGNCDNCLQKPATRDVTEEARKLLSAVYRTGQSFGLGHLAKVLRGTRDERISKFGHDALSVFGIGQAVSDTQWQRLGRFLEASGALVRDAVHGGLALSDAARPILRGAAPVTIRESDWQPKREKPARAARASAPVTPDPGGQALFEALRLWWRERAKADDVPAYAVLPDTTLAGIAATRPASLSDLGYVSGIGAAKLERYGTEILAVVAATR